MKNTPVKFTSTYFCGLLLAVFASSLLSACGGGGSEGLTNTSSATDEPLTPALLASGVTTLQLEPETTPEAELTQMVMQPAFHLAPALLPAPDDIDAGNHDASARRGVRTHRLQAQAHGISTRQLDWHTLKAAQTVQAMQATSPQSAAAESVMTAMATSSIGTYSPAQIRAAYGLPSLPVTGATPTAAQAAQMGAGQTIYIVDAYHNPNVAAELAAFNQKFGLPTCTTKAVAVTTVLPLTAPSLSACELSVVYSTAAGTMTTAAPAYNSGWATEIAMDVQWAHATAPLARIVLIEAADPTGTNLGGAIKLANAMGPGAVSMSFGGAESSATASLDSLFTGANMTYLASTGDSGAAVSWPSVSPKVVAVGGTTLTYTGTGARTEVAWSGTGGGTSAYTAIPSYQTNLVPGMGTLARRTVADVSFNADPASGQYVAVMSPGSATVNWLSAGGTSISAPQWAGVIAMANASRLLAAKPLLGLPHAILYGQISTVPGSYANVFGDVAQGSHGTCSTCTAKTGYDELTGLGTPNVANLLTALTGAASTTAPVVTPAAIAGKVGVALSFTISSTAVNPNTYSLTGAPAGMVVSTSGVVSWPTPVAGTYAVTAIAKDTKTGLTGQAVYTVTIAPPAPPVVGTAAISGKAGTALTFTPTVTAANPVALSMTGAPAGMTLSTAGVITWTSPVAGTYAVTVIAKDTKTGLSGQGAYTVAISAPLPPTVSSAAIAGKPGLLLSFSVTTVAPNPVTYTLSGAPAGMTISAAGLVTWSSPVAGNYTVTVVAKDTKTGLSGQGVYTLKIAATGPVITALAQTGVVGKPIAGSISITDAGAITWMQVSITGAPLGMSFAASGLNLTTNWTPTTAGNYSIKITALDSLGLTAQLVVPITVTAK